MKYVMSPTLIHAMTHPRAKYQNKSSKNPFNSLVGWEVIVYSQLRIVMEKTRKVSNVVTESINRKSDLKKCGNEPMIFEAEFANSVGENLGCSDEILVSISM
jgi:hypothetical protein